MPDVRDVTVESWGTLVLPLALVSSARNFHVEEMATLVIYPDQSTGEDVARMIEASKPATGTRRATGEAKVRGKT